MKIVMVNRKKYPSAFSFERLFNQLKEVLVSMNVEVAQEELPHYNNGPKDIISNILWIKDQLATRHQTDSIKHITGDVNSVVFSFKGPSVITIHDCNPMIRYGKSNFRHWISRYLMYEWPAKSANAITVISEKTRRNLLKLTNIDPKKVHLIPNFVDPSFVEVPKSFNAERPTILQVGVKAHKNLGRVAQALSTIPCRLEIIGKPLPEDQAILDKLDLDYTWSSNLTDEELRDRYASADIIAFATTFEGFGLPILEAQKTGRAVVTSDLSPHKEVAGPGGAVLVDPESIQALHSAFVDIIEQPALREALVQKGRENVAKYDIQAIARQYLELYESIS